MKLCGWPNNFDHLRPYLVNFPLHWLFNYRQTYTEYLAMCQCMLHVLVHLLLGKKGKKILKIITMPYFNMDGETQMQNISISR